MISKYFNFNELNTNYRNEIVGGITTFFTMSYIVIVNPKILEAAGMPFGASMMATIITAFLGTLALGVYAKRPFAIAPYMGENAFIAFTVVKVMGYSWQTAIGAIFISGIIFTFITLINLRSWLSTSIPTSMKIAFAVGIGLFLTFIGLNETGIVTLGVPGAPVKIGNLHDPKMLLALAGFLLTAILLMKKIKGALLIGILTTALAGFLFKLSPMPAKIISMPPSLNPILLKLDVTGALSWGFVSVIITVLVMDFVDTMGTLIGVSYKAGLLDQNGNLPEIEKPFLCDALSTVFASLIGTTTAGIFIESATGIEAGARSGFASVITAFLFLLMIFFSPLFTAIPPYAYGVALIIVGLLMLEPIKNLNFKNYDELVPAFVIIALMSFTYNIGIGMTGGFVVYPIMKLFNGKIKEVKTGMWILFSLSLLFFVFYKY